MNKQAFEVKPTKSAGLSKGELIPLEKLGQEVHTSFGLVNHSWEI